MKELDKWADWLRNRRFGNSNQAERMQYFYPMRDRVIKKADIQSGDTILDVGCGEGMMGFRALDFVGSGGKVIFSDISQDCLDLCKEYAVASENESKCSFILSSIESLDGIQDNSIDVILSRSVVMYSNEKQKVFDTFHRVLKDKGRLSLFEPINSYGADKSTFLSYLGYDLSPVEHLWRKIAREPDNISREDMRRNNPLSNYTERDLQEYAWSSGFERVEMELEIASERKAPEYGWDTMFYGQPNPNAPSLHDIVKMKLSNDEFHEFAEKLKVVVDERKGFTHQAVVYLSAVK